MNADEVESEVWDAIEGGEVWGDERDELAEQLDEVIAWRAGHQGASHPDLIWPLALHIALVLSEHDENSAAEAAAIGERRLAIQREVLRDVHDELIEALRTQARLYKFEDEVFDKKRHAELLREVTRLEKSHGR